MPKQKSEICSRDRWQARQRVAGFWGPRQCHASRRLLSEGETENKTKKVHEIKNNPRKQKKQTKGNP